MIKHNDTATVIFPVLEQAKDEQDYEIIIIFLSCFRDLPNCRGDARVFQSIHKTADLVGYGDGLVTKILIDHGLRAPRQALPQEFLNHIDGLALRKSNLLSLKLKSSYNELKDFWSAQGGSPFAFVNNIQSQRRIPSFQGA